MPAPVRVAPPSQAGIRKPSHERSSELRQRTIPLYSSFIPSHALCFRSYNRAAARDFYTRGRDETNAHPNGHPVAWRVCHRSRAGQLADQRGEHGDRRNRAVRPRSDLRNGIRNGRRLQSLCVRAAALSVRRIAERHADAVFQLRFRSGQRHLSDFGETRGCDNGTNRQHQRQRANRHAQRHVGRWWCWRRCLIELGLLGRDIVNGRQRRPRRSLRRHRRMLAAACKLNRCVQRADGRARPKQTKSDDSQDSSIGILRYS
jgi:hypothetical protein